MTFYRHSQVLEKTCEWRHSQVQPWTLVWSLHQFSRGIKQDLSNTVSWGLLTWLAEPLYLFKDLCCCLGTIQELHGLLEWMGPLCCWYQFQQILQQFLAEKALPLLAWTLAFREACNCYHPGSNYMSPLADPWFSPTNPWKGGLGSWIASPAQAWQPLRWSLEFKPQGSSACNPRQTLEIDSGSCSASCSP